MEERFDIEPNPTEISNPLILNTSLCTSSSSEIHRSEEDSALSFEVLKEFCFELNIDSTELLSVGVLSNLDFMTALTDLAASMNFYNQTVEIWKQNHTFIKKTSKVSVSQAIVEEHLSKLRISLQDIADCEVSPELFEDQQNKVLLSLPLISAAKQSVVKCLPIIQNCIRVKERRDFLKSVARQQNNKEVLQGSDTSQQLSIVGEDTDSSTPMIEQSLVTPEETTTDENASLDDSISGIYESIEDDETSAQSLRNLCVELQIDSCKLLTDEVLSNLKFITDLTDLAVCLKYYYQSVEIWKQNQMFAKTTSKVSIAVTTVEEHLSDVQRVLQQISDPNMTPESYPDKSHIMLQSLTIICNAKESVLKCRPLLLSCIRAKKHRLSIKKNMEDPNEVAGHESSDIGEHSSNVTEYRDNSEPISVRDPLSQEDDSINEHQSSRWVSSLQMEPEQLNAVEALCDDLDINKCHLFKPKVITYPCFMTALVTVARPHKEYHELMQIWKENQTFTKKISKIGKSVSLAQDHLMKLKNSLNELTKTNELMYRDVIPKLLRVMADARKFLEKAIATLKSCIRAQRHRQSLKSTIGEHCSLMCSNMLELNWEKQATEGEPPIQVELKNKDHKCGVCEAIFPTRYKLLKHKTEENHVNRKSLTSERRNLSA